MRANPGHETAVISVAAFNFIVHEPRGIMVLSRARSRSANFRSQRNIEVSLWWELKNSEVQKGDCRLISKGMPGRALDSSAARSIPSTPKAASTASMVPGSVVSSRLMPTVSSSMRRRLHPCSRAEEMISSALPGTSTEMVSKKVSLMTLKPASSRPVASIEASRLVRWAIRRRPAGPW
ncbi:MAG: hypothetical protein MAG471_00718 [Acidimicrobiaceae bacterium]|nr:hypothetical protein [Acidimicrobiaceae bacterium]